MTWKLIVAGSRDFDNFRLVADKLDTLCRPHIRDDIEVVSGGARGADRLGEQYAAARPGCVVVQFIPQWQCLDGTTDRGAGYRRNEEMAEYADALAAFWDGKSRGTKHMIDSALQRGLEVHVYRV